MEFRYRVEGVVEIAFILRAMHYRIGGRIETDITESELPFIEAHCRLDKVVDLKAAVQPMPEPQQTKKGVRNDKSNSHPNKGASKAKVPVDN